MNARLLVGLACLLPSPPSVRGQASIVDPINAVIRMPSHGCSATVIYVGDRSSFFLSCGHVFRDPRNVHKRMTFNLPAPWGWPGVGQWTPAAQRIIAFDTDLDLALFEVAVRAPYCCPVAGWHYRPGRNFASVGYDEMRGQTARRATPLGSVAQRPDGGLVVDQTLTFTVEPPWHGRSGGALVDLDNRVLIGVCSAYMGDPRAARAGDPRGGPGMYVSHRAILGFLVRSRFLAWPY